MPRGINPKGGRLQQITRKNRFKLPEYLDMSEVFHGKQNVPGARV